MNLLIQTTTIDWVNAAGWTLLHSVWQSLIIVMIVAGLLRFGFAARSGVRYAIACGGLLLTILVSGLTFLHYTAEHAPQGLTSAAYASAFRTDLPNAIGPQEEGVLISVINVLEQNMSWVVLLWVIGFSVFAIRTVSGIFATYDIRADARPTGGEWTAYVQRTAYSLGITRIIRIAESTRISGPMVIGYFKPLILIPVGMIGGLTTQQLETVFLHELAHIRRHDYLVNMLQIAVENIFFFNPFVRILSNIIRREREYCCDDLVVSLHGNTSAYAHALFRLAENQLASPVWALSLAGHKNELLNRIKRIMERPVRAYNDKRQLVVRVLFVLSAFVGISWISAEKNFNKAENSLSSADTIPDKESLTARYSRRSVITIDENGQPHEEIVETFDGDEELKSLMDDDIHSVFNDSIPPFAREDWDAFGEMFHNEFRQNLQRLFRADGDPHELMEAFENAFQFRSWGTPFHAAPADSLNRLHDGSLFKNFREEFEKFQDLRIEEMEHLRENHRSAGNPVQKYEQVLRDELIQDGYFSPHDRIETLEWNDENFKVNGKSLKQEHIKKYNALRKSTLQGTPFGVVE